MPLIIRWSSTHAIIVHMQNRVIFAPFVVRSPKHITPFVLIKPVNYNSNKAGKQKLRDSKLRLIVEFYHINSLVRFNTRCHRPLSKAANIRLIYPQPAWKKTCFAAKSSPLIPPFHVRTTS